MSLFPMTETTYWTTGPVVLFISSLTGLLIGKFKMHDAYKGFVSGFQYAFIFWTMLYMAIFLYLK